MLNGLNDRRRTITTRPFENALGKKPAWLTCNGLSQLSLSWVILHEPGGLTRGGVCSRGETSFAKSEMGNAFRLKGGNQRDDTTGRLVLIARRGGGRKRGGI